ncbi:MAG: iron-sulfur cluster repair protein YtfE [Planctomycetota bacterium]
MTTHQAIQPTTTLAELAVTLPGASRVFHRHGLDFCCGGRVPLAQACEKKGLDPQAVLGELQDEQKREDTPAHMAQAPLQQLIGYILERFHEGHRAELPRLLEMATKVERVHGEKPTCPTGLAKELERVVENMESHLQKEEQVLFPLILAGRGALTGMPISVMEQEHQDHGQSLARLRALTHDYTPPAEACNTWQALYLGLAEFESELMEHIHLENNSVFPRALSGE